MSARVFQAVVLLGPLRLVEGKKSEGPLCHSNFRMLETCLQNDYDRLQAQCAGSYDKVKRCLDKDWRHIDDAGGYKRPEGAFNRMKACRHGLMLFNPMDWYIGRSLEVYGEWGEKKVDMWRRLVKPGQVVVDIGAHIGTLTLPLSRLVGAQGRVVAFEPFVPSFTALSANIGLNSLQNVELKQAVVADRSGKLFMSRDHLAFSMSDFFNFGSMGYSGLQIHNITEDVERPSSQWDEYAVTLLDRLSLPKVDFIKIDAEAMEHAVLRGAQRMIKKNKPLIFMEYREPWRKDTGVLDFLRKKLKYECLLLRLHVFNGDNFRKHSEDIFGGAAKLVSFNLLCKHRWWEYPDMDETVHEIFDLAVDTDIDGLRTTPTADPFESMAGFSSDDAPDDSATQSKMPSQRGADAGHEAQHERVLGGPKHTSKGPRIDLTLDELLDGVEPHGVNEQLSLEQLLGHDAHAPAAPAGLALEELLEPHGHSPDEELSLGELLEELDAVAHREPLRPLGSSPADPTGPRARHVAAQVSLPKTSHAASSKPGFRAGRDGKRDASIDQLTRSVAVESPYSDLSLDELLDDVTVVGNPRPPAPALAKKVKRSKRKKAGAAAQRRTPEPVESSNPSKPAEKRGPRRAIEELSLEDLLGDGNSPESRQETTHAGGGAVPTQASPERRASAPTGQSKCVDSAYGADCRASLELDLGRMPKSDEVFSLDDLLGREPRQAAGAEPKSDYSGGYSDISLDELLQLDDPTLALRTFPDAKHTVGTQFPSGDKPRAQNVPRKVKKQKVSSKTARPAASKPAQAPNSGMADGVGQTLRQSEISLDEL